jgi:hypothetical protein
VVVKSIARFFVREIASQRGGDSQGAEEVRGHLVHADFFRGSPAAQVGLVVMIGGDSLKRAALVADVPEVGFAERDPVHSAIEARFPDIKHAGGIAEGQRSKQRRLENAEDHDARAHTESQGRRAGQGQPGIAPQPSQRLPHIHRDGLHDGAQPRFAHFFLYLFQTAELDHGLARGGGPVQSRPCFLILH